MLCNGLSDGDATFEEKTTFSGVSGESSTVCEGDESKNQLNNMNMCAGHGMFRGT